MDVGDIQSKVSSIRVVVVDVQRFPGGVRCDAHAPQVVPEEIDAPGYVERIAGIVPVCDSSICSVNWAWAGRRAWA